MTEEQREKNRVRNRRYYEANKQKRQAQNKVYYERNKEALAEQRRQKRGQDLEGARAQRRAQYRKNQPVECARMRKYRKTTRRGQVRRRQLALWRIKEAAGCMRCGESDPIVLDFHHRDPKEKRGNVSIMVHGNWAAVEAELEKCDVICVSCHARQHRKDWSALFKIEEL